MLEMKNAQLLVLKIHMVKIIGFSSATCEFSVQILLAKQRGPRVVVGGCCGPSLGENCISIFNILLTIQVLLYALL